MTRHAAILTLVLAVGLQAGAQSKPRPDALPPAPIAAAAKARTMAATVDEMRLWNRYPAYPVYLALMRQWAEAYPTLCRIDTIGISIEGRLILAAELTAAPPDTSLPEFLYTSSIHGDELTGYVMLLRLADTLLRGYGTNSQYTRLLNTTRICINPLANPDGAYAGGDNSVLLASRYNADYCDLNRNFPNPFAPAKEPLQPENEAMIAYAARHRFRLSAVLHDGSEVMNYPWDSFTSAQAAHPASDWWQGVCKRFVDTSRTYAPQHFLDVADCGYTAGGDWYVITGGRQDYMNVYHRCLEMTMEISTEKTPSASTLPSHWHRLQHSLVNYIDEIHSLPDSTALLTPVGDAARLSARPNPGSTVVTLSRPLPATARLCNLRGQAVMLLAAGTCSIDVSPLPRGLYLLLCEGHALKLQVW